MAFDQFTTVVFACGVVLIWYLTGLAYNRKLLGSYWIKIRDELIALDANPKLEQLQPSSVTIRTNKIGKQFRNVVITVIVIGRQNLFSFAFSKLQKYRDTISLRADFQNDPTAEFELLNKHYPLASSLLERVFRDWNQEPLAGTDFVYCWKHNKTKFSSLSIRTEFWRMSVRKDRPHLLIVLPADQKKGSQLAWLQDLQSFISRQVLTFKT